MISNEYKCIFIEVPKTGSTSIRQILGQPRKPHLNVPQTRCELECISRLDYLYERPDDVCNPDKPIRLAESLFKEYFKFGFVRNPWDRTVALYERREGVHASKQMIFDDFVDCMEYSSDSSIHPIRHKNQLDWLCDENGNVLVDFIGRFERLEDDWNVICDRLGIDEPLPHANENPTRTKH